MTGWRLRMAGVGAAVMSVGWPAGAQAREGGFVGLGAGRLGQRLVRPGRELLVGWLDDREARGVPFETGRRLHMFDLTVGVTFP